MATAFYAIFNKSIVPKAVQNQDLDSTSIGSVEDFSESLSVKLEQALYENFALIKEQISSSNKSTARSKPKVNDVGQKYRTKFRSLSVILKDDKNPDLHKRIVTGELTPDEFVTLSRDELMNPALKEMAEAVRAESIRNSILVVDDGPRIRRTHKGEEYIDNAFEEQQKQDWKEEAKPESSRESTADKEQKSSNGERDSARNSPIMMAPQEPILPSLSTDTADSNIDYNDYGDNSQQDNVEIDDGVDLDEILNSESKRKTGETKMEEQEDDAEYDPFYVPSGSESKSRSPPPSEDVVVYTGQVMMPTVAEFPGTAVHLSGPKGFNPYVSWSRVIDAMAPLSIEGRLDRSRAAKYLQAVGQSKDIISFVLRSDEGENASQFNKLFNYFTQKEKYGVIVRPRSLYSTHGPQMMAKDAYLIPLKEGDDIPDYLWLTSFEAQEKLESYLRTDKKLLLGLYVLANRVADQLHTPPTTSRARSSVSSSAPWKEPATINVGSQPGVSDPQALLSLLQQMNSSGSKANTTQAPGYNPQGRDQHLQYYAENDDDYEP